MVDGRVGFVLGAGVSLAAGMPSTADLTGLVLAGQVIRGTDSHYRLISNFTPGGSPAPLVERVDYLGLVRSVLGALKTEVDSFYVDYPAREANYEDLYYMAVQIADAMSGEFDNPALRLLAEKLTPVVEPFFSQVQYPSLPEEMLLEAGNETVRYIEDVVWQSLVRRGAAKACLSVAVDAARDTSLDGVDFITLNHDTLIEQRLRLEGIPFVDGFDKPVGSVCAWNPASFKEAGTRIRVMKLHGSVDWCAYSGRGLARTTNSDFYHVTLPDGTDDGSTWGAGHPTILCGTFNKMLEYLRGPFLELHLLFREALGSIRLLVVSGYGFGDKGVNSRIWEWMTGNDDRQLIVVHANVDALVRGARGVIRKRWDEWLRAGRLVCIPRWFESVTWEEIREGSVALHERERGGDG